MKKIILLFLLAIFHLFAYAQTGMNPGPNKYDRGPQLWKDDSYPTLNETKRPMLSACQPVRGIDYSENTRQPIQPFVFQNLRFETSYGFYKRITLEINASGNTVVNVHDEYYAETTTIRSDIDRNDFTNLLFVLARCDFDSFQEKPVVNDMKCCNSFFEIQFNDQIKKSSGCTFSPFDNRELEHALWSYIVFKAEHAIIAPQTQY
ncbi:MAG: hypothetical protein FWC34_08850 [Bacteroidetes bacterium]|nr:hypothetical protein [Bacteroidota bacterium]MCL2302382.1 hypothetical protein [Lentimicrobiaceae bacterium]